MLTKIYYKRRRKILTKKDKKKILFFLLLSFISMVVCIAGILNNIYQIKKAQRVYFDMQAQIKQNTSDIQTSNVKNNNNKKDEKSEIQSWINEKKKEYPNMIGWIICKDTPINYPVMQADDNSYFLSHLPDGSKDKLGAIFLDSGADSSFKSPVSVIYGHMMKDGEMFGSLKGYRKQDYYDEHQELELYTDNGVKKIELLAAYIVDGSSNPYPSSFNTSDDFNNYINKIKVNSFFVSKVKATPGDKLIILSTCAYDFKNARLAIVGIVVNDT